MGIYIEKYKIKYSDVDKKNQLTISSLVNYLQDAAGGK